MKSILCTFPDDKARDRFFAFIKEASDKLLGNDHTDVHGLLLKETLRTVRLDPPIRADHERTGAIFVSGKRLIEGTISQLQQRFKQEVDSHKATVELKELRDGEWVSIQARRVQR